MNLDNIREWFSRNQDAVIRRGSMLLGMTMLVVAFIYVISIARDLGWL